MNIGSVATHIVSLSDSGTKELKSKFTAVAATRSLEL